MTGNTKSSSRRGSNTASRHASSSCSKESYPCGKCLSGVKEGTKALKCDLCLKWYHLKCTSVTSHKYDILQSFSGDNDGLMWYCKNCKKEDVDKFALLQKAIMDLTSVVEELKKDLKTRKDEESNFEEKVLHIINEEKEKDKRQDNIIVHGIQEQTSEDEDTEQLHEILTIFDKEISPEDFSGFIRLGKKEDNKARPIKVTIKHEKAYEVKKKLFKYKTNQLFTSQHPRVKFVSDRTKKEREDYKVLVDQLNERKAKGEKNLIIKDMKVIKTTDGAQGRGRDPSPKHQH